MAKLSLGSTWRELQKDDKERFVKLYVERMKQSYSSKIDAYEDEKVEIKEIIQPKPNRIALITDLVGVKEKLEIVYKFHKPKEKQSNKDSWLVYDVEILGVSILKTDIAQFKEFLQTKSIAELMDTLAKQS
jgi:phospholipid transport system substrate-binding protein